LWKEWLNVEARFREILSAISEADVILAKCLSFALDGEWICANIATVVKSLFGID
jgi:hypothetical protein